MFCQNCGVEIKEHNQRFCQTCGSKLPTTLDNSSLDIVQQPTVQRNRPQSTQDYNKYSVSPNAPIPKTLQLGVGSHSKKCIAFALLSLAFAVVALIFGAIASGGLYSYYYYYYETVTQRLRTISYIVLLISNILGLLFGILAKVNSSKADVLEADNTSRKVGNVFGIIGIIVNAIAFALAIIIGPTRVFGNYLLY